MKLSSYIILLWSSLSLAVRLEERQACFEDDCLRAINGTRRGPGHPSTGTSDCGNYMTSTVLVDPTITTTTVTFNSTFTDVLPCPTTPTDTSTFVPLPTDAAMLAMAKRIQPRQGITATLETTHGPIPYYATSACTEDLYSSACSCLGVSPTVITSTSAIITSTVTTTITYSRTKSCISPPVNTTSTSGTGTTSTYSITMTLNSTTTVTTVTLTSESSGTATGTGTAITYDPPSSLPSHDTSDFSYPQPTTAPPCATPPYGNTTRSSATPTDTTSEIPTPTPPLCGGPDVAPCNGTCSDLRNDVQNCGACGNVCAEGNECTNGVCTRPACDSRCGWLRACGNGNSSCICGTETGGAGVCFSSRGSCSDFQACNTTIACPLGTVCIPSTCCGYGLCLSTAGCAADGGSGLGPARSVGRMGSDTLGGGSLNRLVGYAP